MGDKMAKKIDMTGWVMKEHGVPDSLITILEEDKEYKIKNNIKSKHAYWKCKCECSNIFTADGYNIRNGLTKSCPYCTLRNYHSFINMTGWKMWEHGQPDSRVEVIQINNKYSKENNLSRRHIYWDCKCLCGNLFTAKGEDLRNGRTKSCGCYQKERWEEVKTTNKIDLIGKQFNDLLVLEESGRTENKQVLWKCKCLLCNGITYKTTNALTSNIAKNCGCEKESRGVYLVKKILTTNNIPYVAEKTYKDCKNEYNAALRYDFYINNHFLLEVDGQQHFYSTGGWNSPEKFEITQKNDKIKDEYAKSHNIPLKRIPYYEWNEITLETIMSDKWLIKD